MKSGPGAKSPDVDEKLKTHENLLRKSWNFKEFSGKNLTSLSSWKGVREQSPRVLENFWTLIKKFLGKRWKFEDFTFKISDAFEFHNEAGEVLIKQEKT